MLLLTSCTGRVENQKGSQKKEKKEEREEEEKGLVFPKSRLRG